MDNSISLASNHDPVHIGEFRKSFPDCIEDADGTCETAASVADLLVFLPMCLLTVSRTVSSGEGSDVCHFTVAADHPGSRLTTVLAFLIVFSQRIW